MCASVVLPRPGRAEDQHVIQRLAAIAGRRDEDLHLLAHRGLADVIGQGLGPDGTIDGRIVGGGLGTDEAIGILHRLIMEEGGLASSAE